MQRLKRIDAMPIKTAYGVGQARVVNFGDESAPATRKGFLGRKDEVIVGFAIGLGVVQFECFH